MFKSLKLCVGQSIDLENLLANLVEYGYTRQMRVASVGDFSCRGGVVDIYPATFELPVRFELNNDLLSMINTFNPNDGTILWVHSIVIILAFKQSGASKGAQFSEESPLENFLDLNIGDFVVHSHHGVGKFLGLVKINLRGKPVVHLLIEYDSNEKLYVPIESMHLVQKYIAFQTRRPQGRGAASDSRSRKPKLYRLGKGEWNRVKARTRSGIQKLAWELLSLQAMRMSQAGFKFSQDSPWQSEFEKTFTYIETPGQLKATQDVKSDMESIKPMDRLLCGDVGYGKTEVAMCWQ